MTDWVWVDGNEAAQALPALNTGALIALDTEFLRTRTYFPQPCLLQVCVADQIWLLDVMQPEVLQAVRTWLQQARPDFWLMHSAFEDLEVLARLQISLQGRLWDTQLAAPFAGQGQQPGLQNLLKNVLHIDLDKEATRTDWSQRPLSPEQLRYAANDVRHLGALQTLQAERLLQRGQFEWFLADCETLLRESEVTHPQQAYLRLRGAWNLPLQQQYLLQQLAAWREQQAQSENRPRRHVCGDDVLIRLAEEPVAHAAALRGALKRSRASLPSAQCAALLTLVQEWAQQNPPDDFTPIPRPLPRFAKPLLQYLRSEITALARRLDLPAGLLASRQQLEAMIWYALRPQQQAQPEVLDGWRKQWLAPLQSHLMQQVKEIS